MPASFKTPGVYIAETRTLPHCVAEIPTGIPVFIGHTENAECGGQPLGGVPRKVASLAEYHEWFGRGPRDLFEIGDDGAAIRKTPAYRMYRALLLYFQNGGGPCYIVSVGGYGDALESRRFTGVFAALETVREPDLVVIPEAVSMSSLEECAAVQNAAIEHCAGMRNRFAILDVHDGFKEPDECIEDFRSSIDTSRRDLAAAYYPWLRTALQADSGPTFRNIANVDVLKRILLGAPPAEPGTARGGMADLAMLGTDLSSEDAARLHERLLEAFPRYGQILNAIREELDLVPPSGGIAGVYASVDSSRGVWKAPANVGMRCVLEPAVHIGAEDQSDLNYHVSGKSVNVIRAFPGRGVLVWGARTMGGNDLEYRYVPVRRTANMLAESIQLSMSPFVFEPNDVRTWQAIKSMITNHLTSMWRKGALAGAVPEQAFSVLVGLGESMTMRDIQEGHLNATVLVALTRPAEFHIIRIPLQMPKP